MGWASRLNAGNLSTPQFRYTRHKSRARGFWPSPMPPGAVIIMADRMYGVLSNGVDPDGTEIPGTLRRLPVRSAHNVKAI
jgi:hypothetical protein